MDPSLSRPRHSLISHTVVRLPICSRALYCFEAWGTIGSRSIVLSWFERQKNECIIDEARGDERGTGWSAYKSALKSIASKFGVVLEIHLLKDARPIGADGRHTEVHRLCDLRDRFPGRDETHDLIFTV